MKDTDLYRLISPLDFGWHQKTSQRSIIILKMAHIWATVHFHINKLIRSVWHKTTDTIASQRCQNRCDLFFFYHSEMPKLWFLKSMFWIRLYIFEAEETPRLDESKAWKTKCTVRFVISVATRTESHKNSIYSIKFW